MHDVHKLGQQEDAIPQFDTSKQFAKVNSHANGWHTVRNKSVFKYGYYIMQPAKC